MRSTSAPASDDCIGRAIWALGVDGDARGERRLPGARPRHAHARTAARARARAARHALKPSSVSASVLEVDPERRRARACSTRWSRSWWTCYRANATDDWRWFEPTLTYDNAILPLALFAAYARDRRPSDAARCARVARVSRRGVLRGRSLAARRQHRLAQPRRRESRAPTSKPSMPRRSCSRFAARTR